MNARWYDPALGRWVQPDTDVPLESQGTQAWDRFAYVNNNALRYIDPSGHQMAGDTNENGCSGASSGPACIMDMYSGYGDTDGMDASLLGYARNHPEYNFLNDSGLDDTGRALYANAAFQAAAEGAAEGKISKWDALAKGIAGALAAIIIGGGSGAPDTGGDSPVIAGKGNTGRVIPNNLDEQLAMEQAMSDPLAWGQSIPVKMTDPRWPGADGWVKYSANVNGVEIHFNYNSSLGLFDDFKFK